MLIRFVLHWLILAFGLYIITSLKFLGISADTTGNLLLAAFVLILANTFIKPLLILFTLPLVLLTLGLFLLFINAGILYMLPHFVHGFHVHNFISAFFGSLLLSFITGLFSGYEKRVSIRRTNLPPRSNKVIDI